MTRVLYTLTEAGKLAQTVTLITGATSGIGAATARAFAKLGSIVVLTGRSFERGKALEQEITDAGFEALFVEADVANEDSVGKLFDVIQSKFGRLDFAFNNAGTIGHPGPIHLMNFESIKQTISTNVLGTLACLKFELPLMAHSGGGAIVNNSSIAGQVGMSGLSDYVASKHAIVGMTKSLALEWVKSNIRVNAICPGGVDTPLQDQFKSDGVDHLAALAAAHPMGRIATPEEIAEAVLWLCSPDSKFITGTALPIDGGFLAQ